MKLVEFITMMVQDNETQSEPTKQLHNGIIGCLKIVALQNDPNTEIDAKKTLEDAYKHLCKKAQEKRTQCYDDTQAMPIFAEYFGLKFDIAKTPQLLSDEPVNPKPKKAVVDLSDFL